MLLPPARTRHESYRATISKVEERFESSAWFNSRLAPPPRFEIRREPASNSELTSVPCLEITVYLERNSSSPRSRIFSSFFHAARSYSAKVSRNSMNRGML